MGLDEAGLTAPGRIVAGIGFRRAAPADEIVALVRRAFGLLSLEAGRLHGLATAADRAGDEALHGAAGHLAVPVIAIPEIDLLAADARVVTRSERIEALRGIGSLAEAAALAAAGEAGRLVLPRIASAGATCALALMPVCGQSPSL